MGSFQYFEARQVGQNVAKVKELDSIREFLTSSALTLLIDLGFTFIFFMVMWFYSAKLMLIVLATIHFYIVLSLSEVTHCRKGDFLI